MHSEICSVCVGLYFILLCVITSGHTQAAAAELDAVREQQLKWGAVWSDHARPRVPGSPTDTRGTHQHQRQIQAPRAPGVLTDT